MYSKTLMHLPSFLSTDWLFSVLIMEMDIIYYFDVRVNVSVELLLTYEVKIFTYSENLVVRNVGFDK